MAWSFITLNLPLWIVYLYAPQSRQWSLLAVLAMPGLILPAMCSTLRLFRQNAGAGVIGTSCVAGALIAAMAHHIVLIAMAHVGIFVGDRVGFTRLPSTLQSELNFWKKLFAEQSAYWVPDVKDVLDLLVTFGIVASLTAGWLTFRQRRRSPEVPEPAFPPAPRPVSQRQHTPHSLKMPV